MLIILAKKELFPYFIPSKFFTVSSSDKFGERNAVCNSSFHLTFQELNDKTLQLAKYMRDLEINPGDVVAICMSNCIEFIVAFFAINNLGATILPLFRYRRYASDAFR